MLNKKIKNTIKVIALSSLIFSSAAFSMKKADFIKSLNAQISELQAERNELLGTNATATEYIILLIDAEIAALIDERKQAES